MSSDQDALALRTRFRELAVERLRALNQTVLALEGGEGSGELVDRAMREIHTLKGESRMLGLGALNLVAHRTEDLLLFARRTGRLQDAGWLQRVYAGFDLLGALLQEMDDAVATADDPRALAFASEAEAQLEAEGAATREAVSPSRPSAERPEKEAPSTEEPRDTPRDAPRASGGGSLRVARTTVDEITRTAGEVGVLQAHLRQFAADATRVHDHLRDDLARRRVVGEEVDGLRTLAGELDCLLHGMRDAGFDASIRQHRLQAAVERMRLASVATLFERFPRTVRDLGLELGKEARLVIEGREVGADQQVLDLLADPLVHLIRNAVDHGLEPPETREAGGKPRRGTVRLTARQAGRFFEILVGDDGRGIDPTAIAEAAIRKGLLSEADVGRMSEQQILEQMFRPAFSTRTSVSDVSGRGVGLDVVKRGIEDLGGSIRIESRPGQGSTFVLRLPVSIALVDALVLDLKRALYAIPSAYVAAILEVEPGEIENTGGRDVVTLEDGRRAPVVDLVSALGFPRVEETEGDLIRLVVVAEGERQIALRVPGFVGEMALVQEALDPFLKRLRIVTGTAMLDGGRRVVMLNGVQLLELLDGADSASRAPGADPDGEARATDGPAPSSRKVLVIEDSDLTRSMLVSALASEGWQVLEAVNGRVGLEVFEAETPDVVITDLEMPQVGGWEVIEQIRQGANRPHVPIVVLSTLGDEEAKRRAAEAGADVYLHKASFVAEEILGLLESLIAGREDGET